MSDVSKLLVVVVFLGSMAFMQSMLSTSYTEHIAYTSNYTENETTLQTGFEGIPPPPVCTAFVANYVPFIGQLIDYTACVGSFGAWMLSLMFINSTSGWVNTLFIIPVIVVVGFIVIRLFRGTG